MARKKWRCHIGNAGFHFGGQPWLLDLHWMLEDPFWQAQFSCHWPFILQADCFWKCWGKMWANGWVVCSQPEVLQIMQLIFVIICHKPCGLTMLTEEICNLKTFQVMIACISFCVVGSRANFGNPHRTIRRNLQTMAIVWRLSAGNWYNLPSDHWLPRAPDMILEGHKKVVRLRHTWDEQLHAYSRFAHIHEQSFVQFCLRCCARDEISINFVFCMYKFPCLCPTWAAPMWA